MRDFPWRVPLMDLPELLPEEIYKAFEKRLREEGYFRKQFADEEEAERGLLPQTAQDPHPKRTASYRVAERGGWIIVEGPSSEQFTSFKRVYVRAFGVTQSTRGTPVVIVGVVGVTELLRFHTEDVDDAVALETALGKYLIRR